MNIKILTTLIAITGLTGTFAIAGNYKVDNSHTNVSFTVSHLFSKVTGDFKDYEGTFNFDEKTKQIENTNFTIKAASINTSNQKRDDHLKSPEFFDASKFETLTFVQKKATKIGKKGKLEGDLTIRGITKPVTFEVEYLGSDKDPWGNEVSSFTASTKVKRKDFGLAWNKVLESGKFLVGEEVAINLQVEAHKAK